MIGSLNKIWPWRNPVEWLRDDAMNIIMDEHGFPKKVLMEENVFPGGYGGGDPMLLIVVIMIILFILIMKTYKGLIL